MMSAGRGEIAQLDGRSEASATAPARAVHLLAFLFPPAVSGAGLQIKRVGEKMVELGLPTRFITFSPSGGTATTDAGVPVDRIAVAGAGWTSFGAILRILAYLTPRRSRIMALQLSGMCRTTFALLLWGRLVGVPVIYRAAMLGGDEPAALSRQGFGRLKVWLLGRAAAFVTTTPQLRDVFARFYGEGRVHLITNGVDPLLFRPATAAEKREAREALGLRPEARIVVTNGVVCARKRTSFILDAVGILQRRVDDLQFVNIGALDGAFSEQDKRYRDRVLAQIGASAPGSVVAVEHTDQVHQYLKAADLFVFASTKEGCPNAVLEALTAGLPVVMTKLPGVSGFVLRDGTDGIEVAAADDVEAFAAAIESLLSDADRRQRFGAAARLRAEQEFSLRSTAERYRDVFLSAARR